METRRRPTPLSALVLLIVALLSCAGLSPGPAHGASAELGEVPMLSSADAYGPGIWHEAPEGKTWYGAYRTFPDTFAYCIDAGKQSPLPEYFADATAQEVTAPVTAWALATYADSPDPDVQAALSAIARTDERIDHDHTVPPQEPGELGAEFEGAAQQYETITAEAKRMAGPYTLTIALEPVLDIPVLEPYAAGEGDFARAPADPKPSFPTTNRVTLTAALTTASGTAVPDVPITLEVTGADGPASLTSGTAPATTTLTAEGPGTVRVSASASVAPDTVALYEPTSGTRVQRVITPGEPVTLTDSAEVDLTSQPRVVTEISEANPSPGDTVTDTFTVSGLIGDHTVDVVHELWATTSKPEVGKRNDDAEVVGSVTSTDVGDGTHESPGIPIPADFRGWVYFTETIAADDSTREWTGIHGQPKETGFTPWTPTAQTQARLDGDTVSDEVAVSGLRPGAEARLTVTAYRTDDEPEQSATPSGTEIAAQDITVVADQEGSATVSTEPIDMPVGWVTFVTTIAEDDVHRGWTSEWGIPAETVERAAEGTASPPPTAPSPPEQPVPPEEPVPSEEPVPPSSPPTTPVADRPQAPGPVSELPRTGATGHGLLIGAGIVLIGVGAATLLVTGRRRR